MKKGGSQVDWIFSLAIFLLYLAWYFIFVIPTFNASEVVEDNANSILQNNLTWTITRVPLFVFSNSTVSNEPVIVNFTLNLSNWIMLRDNQTLVNYGRFMFVSNLNQGVNTFWLVDGKENYKINNGTYITGNEDSTGNDNFKVGFNDGLIENLTYVSEMVQSAEYRIVDEVIQVNTSNHLLYPKVSKYTAQVQNVNITSYLFAANSRVYEFVQGVNITRVYKLKKFNNYYVDSVIRINYSVDTCNSYNAKYIDFYDGSRGISFYGQSAMKVCNTNETLWFNSTGGDIKIYAHDGNYTATSDMIQYRAVFGAMESIKGLSLNKTLSLKNKEYGIVEKGLGLKNFNLTITNSTGTIASIARGAGSTDNVYVKNYPCRMLDKYGNLTKCTFNIATW